MYDWLAKSMGQQRGGEGGLSNMELLGMGKATGMLGGPIHGEDTAMKLGLSAMNQNPVTGLGEMMNMSQYQNQPRQQVGPMGLMGGMQMPQSTYRPWEDQQNPQMRGLMRF